MAGPVDGTLPSQEPVDIGDLMRQGSGIAKSAQATIDDLRRRADTAIQNVTATVEHVDGVIVSVRGDVKKITSNGAYITNDASQIIAAVRQGHGTAGKLLTDETKQ